MKYINLILFTVFVNHCFAQKKETIKIPNGIVYNYCDPKKIEENLLDAGILGPLHLAKYDKNKQGYLLFSATEKRTRAEIDSLVSVLEAI